MEFRIRQHLNDAHPHFQGLKPAQVAAHVGEREPKCRSDGGGGGGVHG